MIAKNYLDNGTAIAAFSRISFGATVLPINVVLYLENLKALVLTILLLKLSVSSLEQNHQLSFQNNLSIRINNLRIVI